MTTLLEISARIQARSRKATADALATGRDLIEAKTLCDDADRSFTGWLREQFGWTHRHANRLMNAWRWYSGLPESTRQIVESKIALSALYVAAAADESKALAILALAEKQAVSHSDARRIVGKKTTKPKPEQQVTGAEFTAAVRTILQSGTVRSMTVPATDLRAAANHLLELARRMNDNAPALKLVVNKN